MSEKICVRTSVPWMGTVIALMCLSLPLRGQIAEFHKWNLDLGAGVTPTLGSTSNRLTTGWNFVGGAGYNFAPPFGVTFQVVYDGLGVSNSVLKEFKVPGANAHVWGFTLDPMVRFRSSSRLGFYVIGGGGYYRRVVNFTQPTVAIEELFDPFFGIITPILVQAQETIGTITRVGWGGNIGAGATFRLGESGAKFFTEVRYHHIATGPRPTDLLPVTFGIRW